MNTATQMPDESLLVQAAVEGAREAYDVLVERYFSSVYVIAFARLSDREPAEDLAQEVFLRAYLNLAQLRNRATFSAWVHQMTRNLAVDWIRRGQRSGKLATMVPMEAVIEQLEDKSVPDARAQAMQGEETDAVRAALATLSAAERELVLLHYCEEISQREIARRLGVNHTTISRRLDKASDTLRASLTRVLARTFAPMKPRPAAGLRTLALVAAVAAMPARSKAALAAEASRRSASSVASHGASTLSGLLKTTIAIMATGAKPMSIVKTIAACAALLGLAGSFYYYHENHQTPTHSPLDIQYDFGQAVNLVIPFGQTLHLHYAENPVGRQEGRFTANNDGSLEVEFAENEGHSIHVTLGKPGPANGKITPDHYVQYASIPDTSGHSSAMGYMEAVLIKKLANGISFSLETATNRDFGLRTADLQKAVLAHTITPTQFNAEQYKIARGLNFLPKDPVLHKRTLDLANSMNH